MLDRISGKALDPGALVEGRNRVEETNRDAAATQPKGLSSLQFDDEALISSEAYQRLAAERNVLRLTREALQTPDPAPQADKVARLKDLVDYGRIQDYLSTVDFDQLAGEILNSPTGTFLR